VDSDQAGKLPGLAASLPPSDTTVMSRDIGNGPNLHQGSGCFGFRGPLGPPRGLPVPS